MVWRFYGQVPFTCIDEIRKKTRSGRRLIGIILTAGIDSIRSEGDMANGRFVKFALRVLLSVSALAGESAAQATFVVDFGIRGGAVATDSHQLVRACCGAASVLGGTFAFNLEQLRGTIGPTIGVLLHDRAEVRFEAVRRRFGYRIENDKTSGTFSQHILETTRGHFWQYPLLATYRPGYGATRPFIGGGLDLGGTSSFTTDSQFTSTTQIPGGTPVTTTSADHRKGSSTLSTALYIIGGVDARVSYISIRPEVRYLRFLHVEDVSSATTAVLRRNQFEFLIGISVHPFRKD